jgi:hypothetical protein
MLGALPAKDNIDIDLSTTADIQSVDGSDRRETYCTAPGIFPGLPETPFFKRDEESRVTQRWLSKIREVGVVGHLLLRTPQLWRALFPSLRTFVELRVPGYFFRTNFVGSLTHQTMPTKVYEILTTYQRLMCSLVRADTPQLNTRTLEAL